MKMVVGLGNPGSEYEKTKHNVGFMVIDEIADTVSHTPWREDFQAKIATANIGGEKVLLVKPLTYMNLSGEAVGALMRYYKIKPEDIFCIYDDMDLPVGKVRIRMSGSSGGHNGIKSMIAHVGTEKFPRFKLGIGRPLPKWTVIDHVLAPFPKEQEKDFSDGVKLMAKSVLGCLEIGVEKGMSQFNPSRK